MVTSRNSSRRGASTLGCLISLLIFAAAVYYGVNVGKVWFNYYQLLDEMRVSARLAPSLSDATIRRRLSDKADELGLPEPAHKFTIRRTERPKLIVIETQYSERVQLPFLDYTFDFKPHAEEPL